MTAQETQQAAQQICPECGSLSLFKDGKRKLKDGSKKQRYLCQKCEYRFTEGAKYQSSYVDTKSLNYQELTTVDNRLCAKKEAKKLVENATVETAVAGEEKTKQAQEARGKILELCVHMKRQNYSDETIRLNRTALKVLFDRGANLLDPNSVKDVMAAQTWSSNRLRNVINAYSMFVKLNKMTWEPPRCTVTETFPWIPTEQEIDCLISAAPKKLSAFLQLIKETAMRRGEGKRLQWINVDAERNTITLNEPEKHSNARIWKVSRRLIAQLNALPKINEKVFGNSKMDSLKSAFLHLRKRQAAKLQNPRLLKIGFHTIRHWKATMLYREKPDPFYVRDFLGHKSMKNTEKYVTMAKQIFGQYGNDEYIVKIARTEQELTMCLEIGFEYVCTKETLIFLRKRKCLSSPEIEMSRGGQESMEKCAEVAQPGRALG